MYSEAVKPVIRSHVIAADFTNPNVSLQKKNLCALLPFKDFLYFRPQVYLNKSETLPREESKNLQLVPRSLTT